LHDCKEKLGFVFENFFLEISPPSSAEADKEKALGSCKGSRPAMELSDALKRLM
jgi:hypothetical protein